jgi:ADP-ribosylglycohydrolase
LSTSRPARSATASARPVGRHRTGYEQAIWTTAAAGGDIDITCAIVGGITAAGLDGASDLPGAWLRATEPLPEWINF